MAEEVLSNPSTSRPGSPVGSISGIAPSIRGNQPSFRFTWERRRGPGSVSAYSESESKVDFVGNVNSARGEIQGLNTATLSAGAFGDWSSGKHGFHAISTVLNHPTKRAAPPKAHSTLPTVVPADLPRVRRKDFDPYLKDIAPHWATFRRSQQYAKRARSASIVPDGALDATSEAQSPTSVSMSLESVQTTRVQSSMASLDTVPEIYFSPDFNLTHPATFALVTEQNRPTDDGGNISFEQDPASISYSLPLLEKLSHYADTVEGHLVQEIQARSSSFFSALTNLHDLQSESERCLRKIVDLKAMLQQIDEKGAKKGLELAREDNKISKIQRLEDGVELVRHIQERRTIAQGLTNAGDWKDALNVVEDIRSLLDMKTDHAAVSSTQEPGRDQRLPPVGEEEASDRVNEEISATKKLSSVIRDVSIPSMHAFSSLPDDLRDMTLKIAMTLTREFADVTMHDLALRIAANGPDQELDDEEALLERLNSLVVGLFRTGDGGVKDALDKWREVVLRKVEEVIEQKLASLIIESGGDSDSMGSLGQSMPDVLVRCLQEMAHEDFLRFMKSIYAPTLRCLEGANMQSGVLLTILNRETKPSSKALQTSKALDKTYEATFSSILFAATELAHTRIAKIISTRKDQHTDLKLRDFYAFHQEIWTFIVDSEVICSRMVVGLRGTLGGQSKAFLQALHQERLKDSAKKVEDEQWAVIEVSPRSQRVATLMVDSAVRDAPELIFTEVKEGGTTDRPGHSRSHTLTPDDPVPNDIASTPSGEGESAAAKNSKYLMVDDRQFYVVAATIQVLGMVIDYLRVAVNFPSLNMECMSRLVEFLKAFNSRTCQVVLGAGAMRSAGLRNITARHLALASQSLSIVIALIPYIRETFRRHLSPQQFVLLTEFDRLRGDYQNHQEGIHAKLIEIMGERLSFHCKSLQEVNWGGPTEQQQQGAETPNAYMQALVKETVTLHKVLSKYLGSTTTEPIMSDVFASINHRLGEEYQRIPLPSVEAKERMLSDARFLHEKISALRGAGSLSNMLETIVQEKPIVRPGASNANGITNGAATQNSSSPSSSTPRPRGSIDLQAQPKPNVRQNSTSSPLSGLNNIAARPSPFSRARFANLLGGQATSSDAAAGSTSNINESREDTSIPGTPSGSLVVGSSGVPTPALDEGRASPVAAPSPPHTPGPARTSMSTSVQSAPRSPRSEAPNATSSQ